MKNAYLTLVTVLFVGQLASASNWQRFKGDKPGLKCKPSYYLNMKVESRIEKNQVKVRQKSIGHTSSGLIELNVSADKAELPVFGENFLDIFVELKRSENGLDYWIECLPKDLRPKT